VEPSHGVDSERGEIEIDRLYPELAHGAQVVDDLGVAADGAPIATNSSSSQPAPTPTMSRPPDITSMVARIFAVSTAGRCGTTITEVRNFSLEVLAAR
jgi:hypothetical protein